MRTTDRSDLRIQFVNRTPSLLSRGEVVGVLVGGSVVKGRIAFVSRYGVSAAAIRSASSDLRIP